MILLCTCGRTERRAEPRTPREWWAVIDALESAAPEDSAGAAASVLAAGDEALPWLLTELAIRSGDSVRWTRVSELVGRLRPEGRHLLKAISQGDDIEPVLALWRVTRAAELRTPAAWVAVLKEDQNCRIGRLSMLGRQARFALASLGDRSYPDVLALLEHSEARLRYWGASTLAIHPSVEEGAILGLAELLDDEIAEVRAVAVSGLVHLGTVGGMSNLPKESRERLARSAASLLSDARLAEDVLMLLQWLRPEASKALVQALIGVLEDEDGVARWSSAAEQLGLLGPSAEAAIPRLEQILSTCDVWSAVDAAGHALHRIRGP